MIKALLAYQEQDSKLKEIEMKLSANEDGKKAFVAKKFLQEVPEMVNQLEAKAGELTRAYKDLALRQNELIEHISEYDIAADNCGEDEVEYIRKKAKELEERIGSMTQELKKLEENIEAIVAKYNQLKKKTIEEKKIFSESGEKYKQAKAEVQGDRDAIAKKLEVLAKDVDPDLLALYQTKRKDKMSFPIVVKIAKKADFCPACGMELSLREKQAFENKKIGECERCHKILYVED